MNHAMHTLIMQMLVMIYNQVKHRDAPLLEYRDSQILEVKP